MKFDDNLKTAVLAGAVGASAVLVAFAFAGALGFLPLANDARLQTYLMDHPRLVYDMVAKAQDDDARKETIERQKRVDKLGAAAFLNPALAYVTGPANAKNTFVEFFDYNCGYCRRSMPAVKAFYAKHKADTRFAFIELPINGEASTMAAAHAIAARRQGDKYLALHFMLMGESDAIDANLLAEDMAKVGIDEKKNATDVVGPEVEKAILAAHKLAEGIKISGTPAFIVNGKVYDGAATEKQLEALTK
jgi:protein-disulfide isomerase